jgi:hypothetical protein
MGRRDLELLRGAIDIHAHTAPAPFKRHMDDSALAEPATVAWIPPNHSRYHTDSFSMPDYQPLGLPGRQPTVAGDETP